MSEQRPVGAILNMLGLLGISLINVWNRLNVATRQVAGTVAW